MTEEQLEIIRDWDRKCGTNELTFFPVTLDRRRLLEYVNELRGTIKVLNSAISDQQSRAVPCAVVEGRVQIKP